MGYISLCNVPFTGKISSSKCLTNQTTRRAKKAKQFSKFGAKGFDQLTADKHQQEVEADFTDAEQRALKHIYTHAHEHIPDAMAPLSQMELAAAILDIVPQMDAEVVTIRIIMQKLATRFGVDFETIRKQKAEIKALVMANYGSEQHQETEEEQHNSGNGSNAEKENVENASKRGRVQESPVKRKPARKSNAISDESDEEDASEQEDEEEEVDDGDDSKSQASDSESDVPKRKRASSKSTPAKRKAPASKREKASKKKSTPPAKKPRQTASTDSPGIAALKEMARAARLLSPRVYASLKKLDSAEVQEEFIRDMLHNNGIKFSGRYPHKREIDDVRRKKDLEKDLEGIDTSLIIEEDTSSRSRRSSRSAVSYADQLRNRALSDEEEDEEDEEKEEEKEGEEDDSPKAKKPAPKRKKVEESEEESEDDDDEFEANDSDSSEAEF